MPLSAEELAAARKACAQIHSCEALRRQSILWPLLSAAPFCLITFDNLKKGQLSHVQAAFFVVVMMIMWPLCLLIRFRQTRYLQSRYSGNLLLLENLKQKNGAELPGGIYTEIIEEHPLLEHWNRRLEKRAILWRLDAFLSRKSTSPNS